jgi:hypothetical protein
VNAAQLSIFDVAPYRPTETSVAGAVHIAPKTYSLENRVLLTLHRTPGLTDAGLDRALGVEAGRSARPRRNRLMKLGYIEQAGTCVGDAGVANACWQLTASGEQEALRLLGGPE